MGEVQFEFNGVNGATGEYLLPRLTPRQVAKMARGGPRSRAQTCWHGSKDRRERRPKEGLDPRNLEDVGWGVIFAQDAPYEALRDALQPLLELRRSQAARRWALHYREILGPEGYRAGENKNDFLARHGAGPGPVDPEKMPYYLLLVGDPETIPFRFQYQLDVQYAVGRIHFETLEEYAQYAESVVRAETGGVSTPRRAVFFGVRNPDDVPTSVSADYLIRPLAKRFARQRRDWTIEMPCAEETTKGRLRGLLGGAETPSLLFTACHGMGFPAGDTRQQPHQGALLCQEWPGPKAWRARIPQDHYFAADDIDDDASPRGLIAFQFACFGAGTPRWDDFDHRSQGERRAMAPRAFLSRLPQRLLGHPRGGALAVVGHIERVWGYSFLWDGAGAQLAVFESALQRLMKGHPVGSAMEFFNQRYAELSSDLATELTEARFGDPGEDRALSQLWLANNDAKNYIVFGDPAVRLAARDIRPTTGDRNPETSQDTASGGSQWTGNDDQFSQEHIAE